MKATRAAVAAIDKRNPLEGGRPLVSATYLAPNNRALYQFITAAVGERLGMETRLEVGTSFSHLIDGQVDVAFLCGLPYVRLAKHVEPLVAPVLAGDRYRGRPLYFSDVIVARQPLPIFCGPAWRLVGFQRAGFPFRVPCDAGPAARAQGDGSVLRPGGRCRLARGLHRARRIWAARRIGWTRTCWRSSSGTGQSFKTGCG